MQLSEFAGEDLSGRRAWDRINRLLLGALGVLVTGVLWLAWARFGDSPGITPNFYTLAGGRTLVMHGSFADGSGEQFVRALQQAPGVSTIILDSDGGWETEALQAAQAIRARKLTTYVAGRCADACLLAFLAGAERTADLEAHLRPPRYSMIENVVHGAGLAANVYQVYRDAGLPDALRVRSPVAIPPDDLVSAHILTREPAPRPPRAVQLAQSGYYVVPPAAAWSAWADCRRCR